MTYLIPCSSSKQEPVDNVRGSLDDLFMNEELYLLRNELIAHSGIPLDWSKTLPAFQLYTGPKSVIYNRVTQENWLKKGADTLILSALFGWVRHTDRLPYYDLKMHGRQNLPWSPYIFWRDNVDLRALISGHQPCVNLLSNNYRRALRHANIGQRPHEYIGRGHNIGVYLNTQLNQIDGHN
jgi:cytoplasmic iron level regulating protein YaaA (DUF328/UPF0246 family)